MREYAAWLLIALMVAALILPGVAGATSGMYEVQVKEYTVHDDGSANVTFNTTFYGPPSYLNSTRAEIKKVGLKNYTAAYLSQLTRKLDEVGYNVSSMSVKILNYNATNETAPITVIVRASLGNFAHYFSWGNVWEIRPDLLMVRDLLSLNLTRLNMSVTFNNTFVYHLPKWAKIIKTPGRYVMKTNGSIINMTTTVKNETVYVHSYIHFKKGINAHELRYLYSKPQLFLVEYTGKKGPENYVTWASSTYENFTVRKDGSAAISILEVYIGRWADYVRYRLATSLSIYGASRTERMLAYYRAKGLEEQGLKITNATAKLYGVNGTGPVRIEYRFLTAPSSSTNYVIKYRPKLGFANFTFPDKALISINKSEILQVKLPEGWKFTEVPKSVSESVNGTIIRLKVSRTDNLLRVDSQFYMRYGTPNQTLAKMMKAVPTVITIGYSGKPVIRSSTSTGSSLTSSSSTSTSTGPSTAPPTSSSSTSTSSGRKICGPAAIVTLALVPILLRKRR